jgi:ribosomal protein S18 acetylase RimI-like enzyme
VGSPGITLTHVVQLGPRSVGVRTSNEADAEFFYRVYASTRTEELAKVPWTHEEREGFLRQQFQAQDHAYRSHYPGAEFSVIAVDGVNAGRLCLHRRADEIRIMDIALLPEFRRLGIGTQLLKQIQQEGETSSRVVTIHVEVFNPAMRLYQRLGFLKVAETGVYFLMEWRPRARSSPNTYPLSAAAPQPKA